MFTYRIINRKTGDMEGTYSRACHTQYEFGSPEEARSSNCHNIYQDRGKYRIAKYRVTYELIEEDVDD